MAGGRLVGRLDLEVDAEGRPILVAVRFPGREVKLQIWRAQVGRMPLFLLDANLPENSEEDRAVTRAAARARALLGR